eukprot:scaffold406807_cov50-Prasinocladus_malaysianus.AAC.1
MSPRKIVTCAVKDCGQQYPQTTGRPLRVCQTHRVAEQFILDGQMSRYCQQCARPHSLSRFSGLRKGCEA